MSDSHNVTPEATEVENNSTSVEDSTTSPSLKADTAGQGDKPRRNASLWMDAFHDLRRRPTAIISTLYILLMVSMAAFPWLWTRTDPRDCDIGEARLHPSSEHIFGTSVTGCDYYAQAIYGARPSILVALFGTLGVVLIGGVFGVLAGYFGGWIDALLIRLSEIVAGLPFLLGGVAFLTLVGTHSVWAIASVLAVLIWPQVARIMRASVISAKNMDYVQAARSLGASNTRIILRHILPNAVAPTIVVATILLGSFVGAEATLTFLGVGLQPPTVSWGVMINQAQNFVLTGYAYLLIFPAGLLVGTVLSFILLGDAVRDALDPKLR